MLRRLFKLTAFKLAIVTGFVFATGHLWWKLAAPRSLPFAVIERLEDYLLDAKFLARGPVPSSGRVVVVGVDEESIKRYGLWPWKREVMGRAFRNLEAAGAAAIGVDVVFSDPDRSSPHDAVNHAIDEISLAADSLRPEDATRFKEAIAARRLTDTDQGFAQTLADCPHLVLSVTGYTRDDGVAEQTRERDERNLARFMIDQLWDAAGKVAGPDGRMVDGWGPVYKEKPADLLHVHDVDGVQAPLPVLAAAVHHVGAYNATPDADGVIRHYPLLLRLDHQHILPSLAMATAAVALNAKVVPLLSSFGGGLDGAGLVSDAPEKVRALVPVDPWTGMHLISYPGHRHAEVAGRPLFDRFSLADAVDDSFDHGRVKDKVVLIGAVAVGTFDQRVTPFDSFTPGIYTHAAVVDSVLADRFLQRPQSFVILEVALLLVLALIFGLVVPRMPTWGQLVLMVALGVLYFVADLQAFKAGFVLSTVSPLLELVVLGFGLAYFNYVTADREKRQIRTAFQHYLAPSVLDSMVAHPERLKLGGDKRELTVFFSDIRRFTTISEQLPPEELSRLLNEYLTPMSDIVFKHQGTLDKYMGDAVMAFWGAPMEQPDHALRACRAAVEMLETLAALRSQWKATGRPDITIGIGLNSGPMAVGNMGSDMFFNYTVMGDNVNLGSRLEGANKAYGTSIIMSEFTHERVRDEVVSRRLGSVRVIGKKQPVGIFELRGIGRAQGAEAAAIADFERGITAYRARSWDEAEAAFKSVLAVWSEDGPSTHYLEDVAEKRQSPPGESWDGVYEMKTK